MRRKNGPVLSESWGKNALILGRIRAVFTLKNARNFWPFLFSKVGVWPLLFGLFDLTLSGFSEKSHFWPKKVAIWPLLKTKVATGKPSVFKGLRDLWPLSHFFFLLDAKKSF